MLGYGSPTAALHADLYREAKSQRREVLRFVSRLRVARSLFETLSALDRLNCNSWGWTLASVREIAFESGVSRNGTWKALQRLVESGILKKDVRPAIRFSRRMGPRDMSAWKMVRDAIGDRSEGILRAPLH